MAAVLGNLFEKLLISTCKHHLGYAAGIYRSPALSCGLRTQPAWASLQKQPRPAVQEIVPAPSSKAQIAFKDIASRINAQITEQSHGRLFAVVHVCGKQFKVTDEDLIVVEGQWAPDAGDRIRLEKVLLVGGTDFTLMGTPLLPPDLAHVEATVVEKSLTQTKTVFRKKRRKQFMRINFFRHPLTVLRINLVRLAGQVDVRHEVEGVEGRVF